MDVNAFLRIVYTLSVKVIVCVVLLTVLVVCYSAYISIRLHLVCSNLFVVKL